MATLYGKGVWVLYSAHLDLALEMASEIGATHLVCKTGHRAMFFPQAARRACDRARAAGLIPFAWQHIHCHDPAGEARVALKTASAGYEGIVFYVGQQAAGQQPNAKELGQRLLEAGLDPHTLYYSSFPDISRHPGAPYAEMNVFCRGGFMPRSYPTLLKPAEVVIHKLTYEEHAEWSAIWAHSTPPIYPILTGYRDERATDRLTPDELAHWISVLGRHSPTFFSIFHAAATSRDLWPALAKPVAPQPAESATVEPEPAPQPTPHPEPEEATYVVVQPDDVVWALCQRHGCTRAQFWEWNGRLWDERGMPRDPDYMQAGWRVRVE